MYFLFLLELSFIRKIPIQNITERVYVSSAIYHNLWGKCVLISFPVENDFGGHDGRSPTPWEGDGLWGIMFIM